MGKCLTVAAIVFAEESVCSNPFSGAGSDSFDMLLPGLFGVVKRDAKILAIALWGNGRKAHADGGLKEVTHVSSRGIQTQSWGFSRDSSRVTVVKG